MVALELFELTALPAHERKALAMVALGRYAISPSELLQAAKRLKLRRPSQPSNQGVLPAVGGSETVPVTAACLHKWLERWRQSGWVLDAGNDWSSSMTAKHLILGAAAQLKSGLLEIAQARAENSYYHSDEDEYSYALAALYDRDEERFIDTLEAFSEDGRTEKHRMECLAEIVHPQSPASVIELLPATLRESYLNFAIDWSVSRGAPMSPGLAEIANELTGGKGLSIRIRLCIALDLLGHQMIDDDALEGMEHALAFEALATRALIAGEVDTARGFCEQAWALSTGPSKRKKPRFDSEVAPILTLLMATGSPMQMSTAVMQVANRPTGQRKLGTAYAAINSLLANSPVQFPRQGRRGPLADTSHRAAGLGLVRCLEVISRTPTHGGQPHRIDARQTLFQLGAKSTRVRPSFGRRN
jgi:hypothetical protein